jgi:hypothetical protein
MSELEFTHMQFKKPVIIYVDQVFAVCFAPTMNSVVLIASGGAAIPVEGELEEVNNRVSQAKLAHNKGDTNGI